ncbi:hypothetical protein AB1N83_013710 [Pleurotus pulmonarius]
MEWTASEMTAVMICLRIAEGSRVCFDVCRRCQASWINSSATSRRARAITCPVQRLVKYLAHGDSGARILESLVKAGVIKSRAKVVDEASPRSSSISSAAPSRSWKSACRGGRTESSTFYM